MADRLAAWRQGVAPSAAAPGGTRGGGGGMGVATGVHTASAAVSRKAGASGAVTAGASGPATKAGSTAITAGASTPITAGASTPITAGASTPIMAGAGTPIMAGGSTPIMAGASTHLIAGATTPITAGATTPTTAHSFAPSFPASTSTSTTRTGTGTGSPDEVSLLQRGAVSEGLARNGAMQAPTPTHGHSKRAMSPVMAARLAAWRQTKTGTGGSSPRSSSAPGLTGARDGGEGGGTAHPSAAASVNHHSTAPAWSSMRAGEQGSTRPGSPSGVNRRESPRRSPYAHAHAQAGSPGRVITRQSSLSAMAARPSTDGATGPGDPLRSMPSPRPNSPSYAASRAGGGGGDGAGVAGGKVGGAGVADRRAEPDALRRASPLAMAGVTGSSGGGGGTWGGGNIGAHHQRRRPIVLASPPLPPPPNPPPPHLSQRPAQTSGR